jgi:hypothetical protein
MHTFTDDLATLPPDQQRVRAKCYHPTGIFTPFPKEALEHSIPARFEAIGTVDIPPAGSQDSGTKRSPTRS